MANNRINLSMRPDVESKLDVLADSYGLSRSAWVALKINQEYDALMGSPEVREKLAILKEIQKLTKELALKNEAFQGLEAGTLETDAL